MAESKAHDTGQVWLRFKQLAKVFGEGDLALAVAEGNSLVLGTEVFLAVVHDLWPAQDYVSVRVMFADSFYQRPHASHVPGVTAERVHVGFRAEHVSGYGIDRISCMSRVLFEGVFTCD